MSQPAGRGDIQTAEEPKQKTKGKNESLQFCHFPSIYKSKMKCPWFCPFVMSDRVSSVMLRQWFLMVNMYSTMFSSFFVCLFFIDNTCCKYRRPLKQKENEAT